MIQGLIYWIVQEINEKTRFYESFEKLIWVNLTTLHHRIIYIDFIRGL